ncbi:methyl-accepting chemotaxis protein [Bacillus massiliigorillae]|uniref:methyl-accepting chemotaxis protein n=1 Tax=Bacillus massiliigorillae TaxID=1243664 RepID=UPI0003A1D88E|nr:methyl-accepting chemotaxis protein [Bacillus massiliigorillae]
MKITVLKKLYLGFSIVILLVLGTGLIGLYQMNKIANDYHNMINQRVEKINKVNDLLDYANEKHALLLAYLSLDDPEYFTKHKEMNAMFEAKAEELKHILKIQKHLDLINEILEINKTYIDDKLMLIALPKNQKVERDALLTKIHEANNLIVEKSTLIVKEQNELINKESTALLEETHSIMNVIIVILSVIVVVAATIAYFISRNISKPVQIASRALESVADGDLTIEKMNVKNKDELGDMVMALNNMTGNLHSVVGEVVDFSSHVASQSLQLMASAEQSAEASKVLANIAQDTEDGAKTQLASVYDVNGQIQEMNAEISNISQSTDDMLLATKNAALQANIGAKSLKTIVDQMQKIGRSVNGTTKMIMELGELSKEISKVTTIYYECI